MLIQSAEEAPAWTEDRPRARSRAPCVPTVEVQSSAEGAPFLPGALECAPRNIEQNFGVENLFATSIVVLLESSSSRRARLRAACNVSALTGANQGRLRGPRRGSSRSVLARFCLRDQTRDRIIRGPLISNHDFPLPIFSPFFGS